MTTFTPTTSRIRYIRDIASGGMGAVGLAVREEGMFRRVYAIKRLLPEHRDDPAVRAMFVEEARIAGLLHHPNVVSVVDIGQDEEGPYLLMDYVQGISLAQLIGSAKSNECLLPVQLCARVIQDIARGLHAAHELVDHNGTRLELVHRDVSPENILVGYDGVARLTDFGIAKALNRNERTSTGILKGKFGYLAPEQLRFEEPTRRSDLFSLGIVLYEMLTTARLYAGDDRAALAKRIQHDPPPDVDEVRSDVHPMMVELLFRMLAKDPALRPKNARGIAERLDAIVVDSVAEEGPTSVADFVNARFGNQRAQQRVELENLTTELAAGGPAPDLPVLRPRPTWWRLGAIAATFALVVGLVSLLRGNQETPEPAVATTPPVRVTAPLAKPISVASVVAEPAVPAAKPTLAATQVADQVETSRERKPKRKARAKTRSNARRPVQTKKPATRSSTKRDRPREPSATQDLMTWGEQ